MIVSLCAIASAQNAAPQVNNVVAVVDTQNSTVAISYDLSDADDDSIKVDLRISADGDTTYLMPVDSVAGDVGFPVQPGLNKQIIWYYQGGAIELAAGNQECFRAKVIADDLHPVDIQEIVDQVDSVRLRNDLQTIEGVRHFSAAPARLEDTRVFIEDRFNAHNLQTERQPFDYNGFTVANVIGRMPGQTEESPTYIIDGHFDTVSSTPGADDNGSGTVGMLEAMRVLSGYSFARSITFIGFDVEEVGLVGSREYVANAIPAYQQTEGVFNFEMIGFTCFQAACDGFQPLGNYIHNIGDLNSTSLRQSFDQAAAVYVPGLAVLSTQAVPGDPNFRRSDHARFWDAGIPALFLTDGANFRNPHYHQSSDLATTLDFTFMSNVVKTTVATVAGLAQVKHSGAGLSNLFDLNITSTSGNKPHQIDGFALKQNYPNPFNNSTRIEYFLPVASTVLLEIYNLHGESVRTLVNRFQEAGTHSVFWNGRNDAGEIVTSGIYLYKASSGSEVLARKMTLLK